MKYFVILLLLLLSINPISYAKYNWNKKNRLGAVGCILLVVLSVALPSILILAR